MGFHIRSILSYIYITLVASHVSVPAAEVYWNKMLPNTKMPNVVKDLLKYAWMEDESTTMGEGKGDVYASVEKPNKGNNIGVLKKGISIRLGHKGRAFLVVEDGMVERKSYRSSNTAHQLHIDPNTVIFFFEQDLHAGKKMHLDFYRIANETIVLPRQIAESIPFSSNKFSMILDLFSIKPRSKEAELMKHTIKLCEEPALVGVPEVCATSLESMIDFTIAQLGKNIQAITTEAKKQAKKQTYTIIGETKKVVADKLVVCHKLPYVYAISYCHSQLNTEVHLVPLLGEDRNMINAVAVCHKDTSAWNPKHFAFELLKVKTGTVPICHFVLQDNIVWFPD